MRTPAKRKRDGSGQPTGDHRLTPDHVLDVVRSIAPIDLDPCSNQYSRVRAKHSICRSKVSCGLKADWSDYVHDGIAFVNPPWSSPKPWLTKCAELQMADLPAIAWVPSSTECQWFVPIWRYASAICFVQGRVHHANPAAPKDSEAGNGQGNVMVLFSNSDDLIARFRAHGSLGPVVTQWRQQ